MTNTYFPLVRFTDIYQGQFQRVHKLIFCITSWKMIILKLIAISPEASKWNDDWWQVGKQNYVKCVLLLEIYSTLNDEYVYVSVR